MNADGVRSKKCVSKCDLKKDRFVCLACWLQRQRERAEHHQNWQVGYGQQPPTKRAEAKDD